MNKPMNNGAIAIDGGGSTCRIAVEIDNKREEVVTGAANVSNNFLTAIETLIDGLQRAAKIFDIPFEQLCELPAYAGLAGVTNADIADRVDQALPLQRVIIEDDQASNLTGALGTKDGAVASIGTGSFLIARIDTQVRSLGGHGLVLGDEASAAWLGRNILARCLHVVDGLESASPLTSTILKEFGNDTSHLISFAQNASPQAFGKFAPKIVSAAKQGDTNARQLMGNGACYIEQALRTVGWHSKLPLCLLGGVSMHYRDFLSPTTVAAVVSPQGSVLDGALTLAKQSRQKKLESRL